MVNSPSRPNLRPPAPVECGGMTPLWNWETCLPVDRSPMSAPVLNQTKSNQIKPPSPVRVFRGYRPPPDLRNPGAETRFPVNQGRKPQQSRLIVLNQGLSRQARNIPSPPAPTRGGDGSSPLSQPTYPFIPEAKTRHPNQASIKAKNPVIVHNQGKSRQTMKKQTTISSANGAAPYQPRATPWVCTPHENSPEGAAQPANQGRNPL